VVSFEGDSRLEPADWPAELLGVRTAVRLTGGWIGTTWRAELTDGREVVVKQCPYPAEVEADGLAALSAAGVPVPDVLGVAGRTLVMQFVQGTPAWAAVGSAVAGMHRTTGPRFGWHRDNRAGRFTQPNPWTDDWPTFFVENRIRPHLADPAVPTSFRRRLERACEGAIQSMLPSNPVASLTHGDLWRGNVVDGRWVIDPEVSFADRELDLACMLMSEQHPLPVEFWTAYQRAWPIPPDFETRRRVLGLHHWLLQVRHFGDPHLTALHADLAALGW
jgi:fructosamine-3-kinase